MFRVCIISSNFYPDEGGAERQLRGVASQLADDGNRILVVSRGSSQGVVQLQHGVEVRRVGTSCYPWKSVRAGSEAAIAVRAFNPGVVVSSQLGWATYTAWMATWNTGTPYVPRLSGGSVQGSELDVREGQPIRGRVLRHLLHKAAAVVTPAEHLVHGSGILHELARRKAVLIPNGVSAVSARRSGDVRYDVAWVGRDDPTKGVAVLAAVARACPDLRFLVIGGLGNLVVAPNVEVTGRISDVRDRLATCRVLLNTSAYEGCPNAVLEALSVDVPVVGFNIAGLRELKAKYGQSITLVADGAPASLACALRDVLRLPPPVLVKPPTYEAVTAEWVKLFLAIRTT